MSSGIESQMNEIFHYVNNWKEGTVRQIFIQQVTPE